MANTILYDGGKSGFLDGGMYEGNFDFFIRKDGGHSVLLKLLLEIRENVRHASV